MAGIRGSFPGSMTSRVKPPRARPLVKPVRPHPSAKPARPRPPKPEVFALRKGGPVAAQGASRRRAY